MSELKEQTLGDEQRPVNQNPNQNHDQSHEWETMARAWISAFPEAKAVSTSEIEVWIDSNRGSLPADLQSMPKSDLVDRLLSIQNYFRFPNQVIESNQVEYQNRFQRTDQWIPVYSWLESLDREEVVKSKDISDWLTANPEIKEQLCSRHSRYHLMHYIKKCHLKILKRREKKKQPNLSTSPKVQTTVAKANQPAPPPYNPLSNFPKDSDVYVAKRKEALQKYEILLELERKLSPHFSKRQCLNN
ncbi:uncharacterized protein LOC120003332 isoform X2 [Tripterygium wilfordii]|uniref:uncharacterized protein LOC120003332 isoform X2 n=1 Tax=Tripterygium wilfordii TaxID=458696 RepID=UPI0018F7F508|nr:uncharacterized protein LOC120003332 isoform X2 [Tripterygium wilfordii]